MNPVYSIIAFSIAVLLVIQQIRVWRYRVLLSPGFYFGFVWSFGFLGVTIFHPVGLMIERYPHYIDELNILAGFTCLCFLYWTKRGRNTINENSIAVHFPTMVFRVLAVILLIAAVSELMRITVGMKNMGEARKMVHDIESSRSLLTNYAIITSKVLSILAGYKIADSLVKNVKLRLDEITFLIMPLIANLFLSVVVGGRVNFVYSAVYYGIGAGFSLPSMFRLKGKILGAGIVGLIIVVLFINTVSSQRYISSTGEVSVAERYIKDKSPVLGAVFGPIVYMTTTFVGYQYRRVDDVDPTHLGYGMYTFNGFINWSLPFSDLLGLRNVSIAKSLNIYYNNKATYDNKREFYYATHSGFLPMVKDFGFKGAFICVFFLTLLSHTLFVRIQRRESIIHCYQIYFFLLFLDYWIKMNFYGNLSDSVFVKLYPLLIIDILDNFFGYSPQKHKPVIPNI